MGPARRASRLTIERVGDRGQANRRQGMSVSEQHQRPAPGDQPESRLGSCGVALFGDGQPCLDRREARFGVPLVAGEHIRLCEAHERLMAAPSVVGLDGCADDLGAVIGKSLPEERCRRIIRGALEEAGDINRWSKRRQGRWDVDPADRNGLTPFLTADRNGLTPFRR